MENRKVLLSIKDLHVKFRVRGRILTAIRGISLDIYENESIAIVGESGSGKSVFTKTFAGMLDQNGFIDQGSIFYNDEELAATKIAKSGAVEKDLSKADVSVNIYAWLRAQELGHPVEYCCAIGDDTIDDRPYSDIVRIARGFIESIGGFEKFAEWGLV